MRRLLVLLVVSTLAVSSSAEDVWEQVFPQQAMREPTGLALTLGTVNHLVTGDASARPYRRQEVAFTSFSWAGEEWRQQGSVWLPDQIPEAYRGAGVVVSAQARLEHMERFAEIAVSLGIPALVIEGGNPGPHYGFEDEGELMGYGLARYASTGDPGWHSYAWLGRVIVRAATALEQVSGGQVTRFVVTGGSKRGSASWIAAAADPRIVGALPTGIGIVNAEETLWQKAARWGLDYRAVSSNADTMAPTLVSTRLQLQGLRIFESGGLALLHDPVAFPDRYRGKTVISVKGTNDLLFPPFPNRAGLARLPGGIWELNVPNQGHSPGIGPWAYDAWAMVLAHAFAGRPIPRVELRVTEGSGSLAVRAAVESPTDVSAVRVWSASDPKGAYLDAVWVARDMKQTEAGRYEAEIATLDAGYTAYFVEVRDHDPATETPGLITTPIDEHRGPRALDLPRLSWAEVGELPEVPGPAR